jgi:hypothetical protein
MPTRNFSIQTDGLFDQYSNLDYQSQLAKRQVERDAENARSEFDRIMALPFRQSLRTDFTPADVENIQLTRDAEPYSQLTARQAPPSIVGGMFSPEISRAAEMEYLQKRQGDMRARAMSFAQLSPMQQADYGFYRGGQQLGDALGGALGGKDPQLQLITQRQQMLSMIDPDKPETFSRAIQYALQTGDRNTALMLNDEMQNAKARKTENLQLQLQRLAQNLYKADGSIDEKVYSTLQGYGAVGQAVIDQQFKGFQNLQTQKAQALGRQLFDKDGIRNKEIEKQLQASPEGRAVLKQFIPETKVFKRGDIITEINPITGKYEIVTPEGLKEVPVGENPIIALIDNNSIDKTVEPFAKEIAAQWNNLDGKGRADSLESLTKLNNTALDSNQRKAEASVGGSNKVQSSTTTPDGTTILVMKDGTTEVVSAQGVKLQGQDRADAIRKSELFGAKIQGMRSQERGLGDFTAKQVNQAFAQIGKIKTNIRNIDQAIDAIDKGANTGVIASRFPNLTAASIQLANIRNILGLDVIGSITFGALSEGELNLALETALPTSLSPKDLKVYLEKKKTAQTKLADYLSKQVTYLSKPGNTLAGWLEKVENEAQPPADVTVRRRQNP